ncbi:DegT/DnrJ/EryC1/StrS family aminotransferase [Massilia yuzhufengensis]|uniref:dTDP-4-amino-4,6-dideoxygalactose transaminase n=1 Tax=Massilia yuzhufengensis TaxID=1164594 RepID=A0A1I1DIJ1_9BURK|nr:DegT/DnrJ/EryC1/StrS family aminotransferase [Massilia yuzhufengensis]SFB74799.1 dTDP-4-amino-4,6-dideoxygalactose transaminase [Massilia yuzhufengensis]
MPEICRFDPSGCGFPPPRVPLLPAAGMRELSGSASDRVPPRLLDGRGVRRFARGRYALHAAFQAAGLGPDTVVLAPSYHCRTMLDPALALGAGVALYALDERLVPDLASIERLLGASGAGARALLVTHYFGFEQPAQVMDALDALCRRHGLLLVEDCAHAWMVAQRRVAAGCPDARLVVASPYKYFPCPDGGMLWGDPASLPSQGAGAGFMAELKALRQMGLRRDAVLPAPAVAPPGMARGAEHRAHDDQPSHYYDRALERRDSLQLTRWLVGRARPEAIAAQRRRRYREWVDVLRCLQHARAFQPELPESCAPYMFPMLISRPDPDFFLLKQAGMPIWRWDDMALSDCGVASRYRTRLLHLPCHQGLSDAQMDWMTTLACKVLA